MTDDTFEWENNLVEIAYAQVNERGDLFNLRLQNNPHIDQNSIIKLYILKEDICRILKKSTETE